MDLRRFVVAITAACFLALGLQPTASAGIVGTQDYLAAEARAGHVAEISAALSRADVQSQLVALGVDPVQAVARAAALSDAELAVVAGQLQALPAGGDSFFAVIGIVFVVLLILELTGVTDIFKKI
jgi:hypothetical protein